MWYNKVVYLELVFGKTGVMPDGKEYSFWGKSLWRQSLTDNS